MDPFKRMKKMLMSYVVIMVMICFMALCGGSLVKVKKDRARPRVPAKELKIKPLSPVHKYDPPIMLVERSQ